MIPAVVGFEQNRKININFTKVGKRSQDKLRRNEKKK